MQIAASILLVYMVVEFATFCYLWWRYVWLHDYTKPLPVTTVMVAMTVASLLWFVYLPLLALLALLNMRDTYHMRVYLAHIAPTGHRR